MGISSSINTGLSNIPDLGNIQNDPTKLSYQIISIYNAIGILQEAIDTYTGNTPNAASQYDGSNPGSAILLQGQTKAYYVTSAAVNAGRLGTITSDKKTKHADISAATTLARGIYTADYALGAVAEMVLLGSLAIYAASTFVPGAVYYLGTNGTFLTAPSTTPGELVQAIGYALSDTDFFFYPQVVSTVVPTPPTGP